MIDDNEATLQGNGSGCSRCARPNDHPARGKRKHEDGGQEHAEASGHEIDNSITARKNQGAVECRRTR